MRKINIFTISVDFDGTCVTHDYPKVGKDIGAQRVLKRLIENKHKLILNTMRSEINHLDEALNWFTTNEIELYGINKNKTQWTWTRTPKVYSHIYIDDAALGCPLKYDETISGRPFVDWDEIERQLEIRGVLK